LNKLQPTLLQQLLLAMVLDVHEELTKVNHILILFFIFMHSFPENTDAGRAGKDSI